MNEWISQTARQSWIVIKLKHWAPANRSDNEQCRNSDSFTPVHAVKSDIWFLLQAILRVNLIRSQLFHFHHHLFLSFFFFFFFFCANWSWTYKMAFRQGNDRHLALSLQPNSAVQSGNRPLIYLHNGQDLSRHIGLCGAGTVLVAV